MQHDEFLQTLREAGLHRVAEPIADLLAPSIRVSTKLVTDEASLPLGTSKFGGQPDLMPGIEWPSWKEGYLDFLGQIHLPDLLPFVDPSDELFRSGWLLFFYDSMSDAWGSSIEDRPSWRVIYQDGKPDSLERRAYPVPQDELEEHLKPRAEGYRPCKLELTPEVVPPPPDTFELMLLDLTQEERAAYREIVNKPVLLGERMDEEEDPESGTHRLFGHPDLIQGDMKVGCELLSQNITSEDAALLDEETLNTFVKPALMRQLLLQLDSDNNMGCMWGDVGALYFWVPCDEMFEKDFSRTWMMLQCY